MIDTDIPPDTSVTRLIAAPTPPFMFGPPPNTEGQPPFALSTPPFALSAPPFALSTPPCALGAPPEPGFPPVCEGRELLLVRTDGVPALGTASELPPTLAFSAGSTRYRSLQPTSAPAVHAIAAKETTGRIVVIVVVLSI